MSSSRSADGVKVAVRVVASYAVDPPTTAAVSDRATVKSADAGSIGDAKVA